ncbi:hypothetical protein K160097B7_13240 [[Clostridium] hylemonae]
MLKVADVNVKYVLVGAVKTADRVIREIMGLYILKFSACIDLVV